jgi:hypothetical protein
MQNKFLAQIVVAAVCCLAPLAAQQDDKKAQDVIANVRRAIGGKKLDAVKSLTVQGSAQRNVGNFQMSTELEVLIDLPDKYIRSETSNGGPLTIANVSGFSGDRPVKSPAPAGIGSGGAMIIRMGPGAPVSGGEKPTPEQQQEIDRQLVRLARQEVSRLMLGWLATTHPTLAVQYSYAGEAEAPDGKAYVIDVRSADGFTARLFVDEKTDLPLMVTFQGPQPRTITAGGPRLAGGAGGQPPRQLTDEERKKVQADAQKQIEAAERQPPAMVEHAFYFDDWREVDGIRFPHAFRRAIAGATSEEWTINKVKVNAKIDPKKFETGQ